MTRKYEFTNEVKQFYNHKLHRIIAVRSFGNVKKGQLGGWIESEDNLSHDGLCWVANEAKVFEKAQVLHNAQVFGTAWVLGEAKVFDNARVFDNTRVFGNVWVYEEAWVYEDAKVFQNVLVCGTHKIGGNSIFKGAIVLE